jgi:hypothetical protein
MSKRDYKILGQAVSEEVYKEYYQMDRRRRYLEEDIKVGRIDIDPKTGRPNVNGKCFWRNPGR